MSQFSCLTTYKVQSVGHDSCVLLLRAMDRLSIQTWEALLFQAEVKIRYSYFCQVFIRLLSSSDILHSSHIQGGNHGEVLSLYGSPLKRMFSELGRKKKRGQHQRSDQRKTYVNQILHALCICRSQPCEH